jgi:hypothetical protein
MSVGMLVKNKVSKVKNSSGQLVKGLAAAVNEKDVENAWRSLKAK